MTDQGRRPTLRDIARLTGVSTSAVSIVARGERGVGEETRQRVVEAMRRLGYAIRSHRTNVPPGERSGQRGGAVHRRSTRRALALVVERLPLPVLSDVAYAEVVSGMQAEARAHGHLLALHEVETAAELEPLTRELNEMAGILIIGSGDLTDAHIRRLAAPPRAAVLVDNYLAGQAIECVMPDHADAGYLATNHLVSLGHRRIAFLPGPRKYKTLIDRHDGYLRALADLGLSTTPELQPLPIPGTPRKGYLQMRQLLALTEPPTAVVATSDKSALGALEALREAGLRVPQDVALVGIDDIPGAEYTEPPLTTVHWPKRELGVLAVRRLLHRIEHSGTVPLKTLVPCQMMVRGTCGAR
jgi:DNA-binding LacI/PurR family transcriptional regulator